jgi:triacylglycerol lipase
VPSNDGLYGALGVVRRSRLRAGAKLRETRALLTQARYLGLDRGVIHTQGGEVHVVLLHGLYASAGVFRPLRTHVEKELEVCFHSFSYLPGPGIVELSHRLEELIDEIVGDFPIHLVGHSLGALVQRYYATGPSCDPRVVQTVSLAAPFRGSERDWLVPGQAGIDISPTSALLYGLRQTTPAQSRLPHLSLVAEEDEMIVGDAFPEYGEHVLIRRVGHNGILFHEEMMSRVLERIRKNAIQARTLPSDGPFASGASEQAGDRPRVNSAADR